jgi:hypothetical protein
MRSGFNSEWDITIDGMVGVIVCVMFGIAVLWLYRRQQRKRAAHGVKMPITRYTVSLGLLLLLFSGAALWHFSIMQQGLALVKLHGLLGEWQTSLSLERVWSIGMPLAVIYGVIAGALLLVLHLPWRLQSPTIVKQIGLVMANLFVLGFVLMVLVLPIFLLWQMHSDIASDLVHYRRGGSYRHDQPYRGNRYLSKPRDLPFYDEEQLE